jgi:hypothetical protein
MKRKLLVGFIKKKVPSATIVEITVAMVLAGTCFVLAFIVFGQLAVNRFNERDLELELAVGNVVATTVQENSYINETISAEDWVLKKKISRYNGHATLLLLEISVTDLNGKELLSRKQLFYVHN